MAYGIYCQRCKGTVDRNEYDFTKDMCRECVEEMEQIGLNKKEVDRMINSEFEQMKIEVEKI